MTATEFRRSVGHFLTGIAVVSTSDDSGSTWGMTVNSFSSVSLDPPLVSICISKTAASHDVFVDADGFGVSILGAHQEDLARRFSSPIANKFENVGTRLGRHAVLLDDSVAWFDCAVHDRVDAGDHTILIGRVDDCGSSGQPPIGYYQGNFFGVSAELATATDRLRRTLAGWLVEYDGQLLLADVSHSSHGRSWSIPMSPIRRAATTSDALALSSRETLGVDVDVTFLYSVIDVPDQQATCFVYRGELAGGPPEPSERLQLFDLEDLPWDALEPSATRMLRRYVEERGTDRFGIFLHLGDGKVGVLTDVSDWVAT